jgi:hypothetical protein
MRPRPRRSGYAMVVVVMFVILFLGLWSLAARQVSSLLRVEQARANRVSRDVTNLPACRALAKALAALQVGYPPTNPYVCQVSIDGNAFALTFTIDTSLNDNHAWEVQAATTNDTSPPVLNPSQFGPTPPPM